MNAVLTLILAIALVICPQIVSMEVLPILPTTPVAIDRMTTGTVVVALAGHPPAAEQLAFLNKDGAGWTLVSHPLGGNIWPVDMTIVGDKVWISHYGPNYDPQYMGVSGYDMTTDQWTVINQYDHPQIWALMGPSRLAASEDYLWLSCDLGTISIISRVDPSNPDSVKNYVELGAAFGPILANEGQVWVGGGLGVYKYDGNSDTFQLLTLQDKITALAFDQGSNRELWAAGIQQYQLYHLSNEIATAYPLGNYVGEMEHLATDTRGNVWVGGPNGVVIFDPAGRCTNYWQTSSPVTAMYSLGSKILSGQTRITTFGATRVNHMYLPLIYKNY